jgi:hypothetical protein
MAKRQTKKNSTTSPPPAGVISETYGGMQGDTLGTATLTPTALADDRDASPSGGNGSDALTFDDIAARAYDLWARRGGGNGSDFEDWLQAERDLRAELQRRSR